MGDIEFGVGNFNQRPLDYGLFSSAEVLYCNHSGVNDGSLQVFKSKSSLDDRRLTSQKSSDIVRIADIAESEYHHTVTLEIVGGFFDDRSQSFNGHGVKGRLTEDNHINLI